MNRSVTPSMYCGNYCDKEYGLMLFRQDKVRQKNFNGQIEVCTLWKVMTEQKIYELHKGLRPDGVKAFSIRIIYINLVV